MTEFTVIMQTPTGEWRGLGRHCFAIRPHLGEYVTMTDEQGQGQAYRVKAVVHPIEPTNTTCDLVLEYVGTDGQWRQHLLAS